MDLSPPSQKSAIATASTDAGGSAHAAAAAAKEEESTVSADAPIGVLSAPSWVLESEVEAATPKRGGDGGDAPEVEAADLRQLYVVSPFLPSRREGAVADDAEAEEAAEVDGEDVKADTEADAAAQGRARGDASAEEHRAATEEAAAAVSPMDLKRLYLSRPSSHRSNACPPMM